MMPQCLLIIHQAYCSQSIRKSQVILLSLSVDFHAHQQRLELERLVQLVPLDLVKYGYRFVVILHLHSACCH